MEIVVRAKKNAGAVLNFTADAQNRKAIKSRNSSYLKRVILITDPKENENWIQFSVIRFFVQCGPRKRKKSQKETVNWEGLQIKTKINLFMKFICCRCFRIVCLWCGEKNSSRKKSCLIVAKVITFYCALLITSVSQPERSNFDGNLLTHCLEGSLMKNESKQILKSSKKWCKWEKYDQESFV